MPILILSFEIIPIITTTAAVSIVAVAVRGGLKNDAAVGCKVADIVVSGVPSMTITVAAVLRVIGVVLSRQHGR